MVLFGQHKLQANILAPDNYWSTKPNGNFRLFLGLRGEHTDTHPKVHSPVHITNPNVG